MFRIKLKELRDDHKISQAKLAKAIGVSQSTVGMWENGKNNPEHKTLLKIAEYFNVPLDYLAGNSEEDKAATSNAVRINVYGSVPAGIAVEAIQDIIDWEEIPSDWVKDGSEFIALKVKGNSMYPKYLDGDIVIIKVQPDCESGQDAIVFINGYDATLKRVIKNEKSIILQPLNPEHETKIYSSGSDPITILGIVVELRRKI